MLQTSSANRYNTSNLHRFSIFPRSTLSAFRSAPASVNRYRLRIHQVANFSISPDFPTNFHHTLGQVFRALSFDISLHPIVRCDPNCSLSVLLRFVPFIATLLFRCCYFWHHFRLWYVHLPSPRSLSSPTSLISFSSQHYIACSFIRRSRSV